MQAIYVPSRRHTATESEKNEMIDTIQEYHFLLRQASLKATPDYHSS